jgi:hypothetical protein
MKLTLKNRPLSTEPQECAAGRLQQYCLGQD